MTYHRTAGKGGTRNSRQERHFTNKPNFNKSTSGGHSKRPSKGKQVMNPPTKPKDTSHRERYDTMMARARAGIKPRRTGLDRMLSGKSDITDRY